MRNKDLFKLYYDKINKLLNGKKSKYFQYLYTKKILDGKDNDKSIEDILCLRNQKNLIRSQAGSGKTYSILKVARQLKQLTVLAVPSRNQALQIQEEYKDLEVKAIVGGVNVQDVDLNQHNILIVVFDKLEEVLTICNVDNLIIDECQELVLATYREKLSDIEKFFIRIIDLFGEKINQLNVIYLTATPNSCMYVHFDNVYTFEQKDKDVFPNGYRLIYYKDDLEESLKAILIDIINSKKRVLIRINDIDMMISLKLYLEELYKGINIGYINSKEKGFTEDETSKIIKYFNDMTECVINKSCLPNCQIFFTTCILDKGININYIENGSLEDLELIYVVKSIDDVLIDNMIQFEARIRNNYSRFNIMIQEQLEQRTFKELDELIDSEYERLLTRKEWLDKDIEFLNKNNYSKKEIKEDIEAQLNYSTLRGYRASLDDSFGVNKDLQIEINLKNFFRYVYLKYNRQFYYNPELLKEFFCKEFEENYYISHRVFQFNEDIVSYEQKVNDILEEVKTNKCILTPSESNDEDIEENKEKHKLLSNSWKLQEMYNLEALGMDKDEAIDLIKDSSKKKITSVKEDLIVDVIRKITQKDLLFVEQYIKEKSAYRDLDLKEKNEFTYKLKKTSYYEYFKKCINKKYKLNDMVNRIAFSSIIKDLKEDDFNLALEYINEKETLDNIKEKNKYVYSLFNSGNKSLTLDFLKRVKDEEDKYEIFKKLVRKECSPAYYLDIQQYIENNKRFIDGKKLIGQASKEQLFIIENIGKYENKDNRYIHQIDFDELIKKLNKNFKEEYTIKEVEKAIYKIFNIGTNGRLNGLRLK